MILQNEFSNNFNIANNYEEIDSHGSKDFPIATYTVKLSSQNLSHTPLHWHNEIQIIYIIQGTAICTVDHNTYTLTPSTGMFINSSHFHSIKSVNNDDCIYFAINLFLPYLAPTDSLLQRNYYNALNDCNELKCIQLTNDSFWHVDILKSLKKILKLKQDNIPNFELHIFHYLHEIIYSILSNNMSFLETSKLSLNLDDKRVKDMIIFIHENFQKKLTLKEISHAGNISQGECCRIFKRTISMTPFEYLISYRINHSISLLRNTNSTITEIAFEVGFGTSSYYIEQFKKRIGCSPHKFRKLAHHTI